MLSTSILSAVILFAVGLILIMLGGDRFVDASVDIAEALGIPQLVVGATIVSLGTTLPEILVSTTAAFSGSADIAAGNAFGSVICNVALIAAITQLIRPAASVNKRAIGWRMLMFIVAAVNLMLNGLRDGLFGRWVGLALIVGFILYAVMTIFVDGADEKSVKDDEQEVTQRLDHSSLRKAFAVLVICAAMLYLGAKLLVNNGIIIAEYLGVPERVIAVTFIALGTSLPELVTAISSLVKGYEDVSLGNVIGANLINLLLVIGIPSFIKGINVGREVLTTDIPLGIAVMLILIVPILIRGRGSRLQGALLLGIYALYCVSMF